MSDLNCETEILSSYATFYSVCEKISFWKRLDLFSRTEINTSKQNFTQTWDRFFFIFERNLIFQDKAVTLNQWRRYRYWLLCEISFSKYIFYDMYKIRYDSLPNLLKIIRINDIFKINSFMIYKEKCIFLFDRFVIKKHDFFSKCKLQHKK